jgi:hypothetical protein
VKVHILADTKAGDSLCLLERLPGPYPDRLSQITVTRTTKTQVHAERNGVTYVFARNGRTIPRGSDKFSACPMTPELSMQIRAQHLLSRARRVISLLPTELSDKQAIEVAAMANAVQAGTSVIDLLHRWCAFAVVALGVDPNHDLVVETKKVLKP